MIGSAGTQVERRRKIASKRAFLLLLETLEKGKGREGKGRGVVFPRLKCRLTSLYDTLRPRYFRDISQKPGVLNRDWWQLSDQLSGFDQSRGVHATPPEPEWREIFTHKSFEPGQAQFSPRACPCWWILLGTNIRVAQVTFYSNLRLRGR